MSKTSPGRRTRQQRGERKRRRRGPPRARPRGPPPSRRSRRRARRAARPSACGCRTAPASSAASWRPTRCRRARSPPGIALRRCTWKDKALCARAFGAPRRVVKGCFSQLGLLRHRGCQASKQGPIREANSSGRCQGEAGNAANVPLHEILVFRTASSVESALHGW